MDFEVVSNVGIPSPQVAAHETLLSSSLEILVIVVILQQDFVTEAD